MQLHLNADVQKDLSRKQQALLYIVLEAYLKEEPTCSTILEHLATSFNDIHPSRISQVYTYLERVHFSLVANATDLELNREKYCQALNLYAIENCAIDNLENSSSIQPDEITISFENTIKNIENAITEIEKSSAKKLLLHMHCFFKPGVDLNDSYHSIGNHLLLVINTILCSQEFFTVHREDSTLPCTSSASTLGSASGSESESSLCSSDSAYALKRMATAPPSTKSSSTSLTRSRSERTSALSSLSRPHSHISSARGTSDTGNAENPRRVHFKLPGER